jgi:glycosyltransferase involved in cell wall biosynthesis
MSADKIRVLAIGPLPPPYHGVATFLRDLLHANSGRVELAHLDSSDRRDASNLGRWDPTNLQLGFSNLSELASRCLRSQSDLVYLPISQNVPAFLRDALFIFQARALGQRVVAHLHGGYFRALYEQSGPLFQMLARAALNACGAVIVLGDGFRGIFSGIVPESKIHVIENGVADPCAWALRPPAGAANCSPDSPTLLYMSTLTRTKGIMDLLRAVVLLRKKFPGIRLNVAGNWADGELRTSALALVAAENLAQQVFFAGNVDGAAKARFLAGGDIFCLPTYYPYEGQPLVLLEAMAAGLPVLGTAHGVIPSTVDDGRTGRLLSKAVTPEAIADALEGMLQDRAELAAFGAAARRRYLSRYTLSACHQRLFALFEKVALAP